MFIYINKYDLSLMLIKSKLAQNKIESANGVFNMRDALYTFGHELYLQMIPVM